MSDNKDKKLNLKVMTKKFKFSINKTEFQLPISQLREDSYNNNEKYIYMNAKSVASVIKQFVKKEFPTLKVWATSDVYSGGSSVRVNVCNSDGSKVEPLIFKKIQEWEYILKAGRFDGMYDIYEYREDKVCTDNGTPLKYFPSYIFIENKPSWGTVEYWINEWNEYQNNYEAEWIEKIQRMGGWLEYNKEYIDKKILDKVISLTVNA